MIEKCPSLTAQTKDNFPPVRKSSHEKARQVMNRRASLCVITGLSRSKD